MRRALLLGALAPFPFFVWSFVLHRVSHPDLFGLNAIGFAFTVPAVWGAARAARRPVFQIAWIAAAASLFWAAVRTSVGASFAQALATVLLFPFTGLQALDRDSEYFLPVGLVIFGILGGFSRVAGRAKEPRVEQGEPRPKKPKPEEPPREEPYFVPRPPEKPKGPALTPKSKEDTPPPVTRVPEKGSS